jgi:hypothetical protein
LNLTTAGMRRLAKHTVNLGRVFALLFFCANAGFTAVVDYCSNDGVDTCAIELCGDQMACDTNCDDTLPAQAEAYPQVDSDCHNVAVVGGLNSIPMVLGTDTGGQTYRLDRLSCVSPQSAGMPEIPRLNISASSSHSGVALHQAVEKYVLNASFLI